MRNLHVLALSFALAAGMLVPSSSAAIDWNSENRRFHEAEIKVRNSDIKHGVRYPESPPMTSGQFRKQWNESRDQMMKDMSPDERRAFEKSHPALRDPYESDIFKNSARLAEERDRKRATEKEQERRAANLAMRQRWESFNQREKQQLSQAKKLRQAGKTAQAVKYLESLYAGGSPGAPLMLGNMYLKGDGVKQDKKKALAWFYKAARSGNSEGPYAIARAYYLGDGVQQDYKQSATWLKASDYSRAQHALGAMLAEGIGGEKSYSKAWDSFKEAAARGYAPAKSSLGEMSYLGLGMRPNLVEAKRWLDDAAMANDAKAFFYLSKMYGKGEGVAKNDATADFLMAKCKELSKVKPQDIMEQQLNFKDYENLDARFQRLTEDALPKTKQDQERQNPIDAVNSTRTDGVAPEEKPKHDF